MLDTTAMLMAAGLDPERCILFRQSDVREHTELTWLLSSVTAYGDLQRMHQFKDKSARQQQLVSASLFTYPVLRPRTSCSTRPTRSPSGTTSASTSSWRARSRAASTRPTARCWSRPTHVIPEVGARIMDLQDPTVKMSTTSSTENGLIYIDEEPDAIRKKVKRAQTDSDARVVRSPDKPGVTNLIEILAVARGVDARAGRARVRGPGLRCVQGGGGGGARGAARPVRERYTELRADETAIEAVLQRGAEQAREIAVQTMAEVREVMGIGRAR